MTDALGEAAGRVLADLGATVIKVEADGGCESRRRAPFDSDGVSFHWSAWGRGKSSVVVDASSAAGTATLLRLIDSADVLLESFTSTDRQRLGLEPATTAARYPSLVHVSVTPFGITGPRSDHPATDLTLAASGGFLNHQGDKDRPPIPIGFPETANHGGVQAAADTIAALYERDRSGLGQHLDVSMQAAVVGTLLWTSSYAAIDRNPSFTGDDRDQASTDRGGVVVPGVRNPVVEPCADGYVVLTFVLGAQGNAAFAAAIDWVAEQGALDDDLVGRSWATWIADMKDGTLPVADGARAMAQLLEFLRTKTKAEIHARSVSHKLLIAPCNNVADLLADSQLKARGFWTEVDGRPLPGPLAILSETPISYDGGAPALGQHQALLAELGETRARPSLPAQPRRPIYEGLKVADLAWMAAGPLVTRELANQGATVVHAETATRLDTMRVLPPFFENVVNTETGLPAANANQSKLGLACNFGLPESTEVIDRLIRWADVVVENFRPGMAARRGFGWDRVHHVNPRAVMLSTSMRGQTGPEATMTGFGLQGAALAGFVDITGWPDRRPIAPWGAYTDFISPRYSLAALIAALRHAQRTGRGQHIDLSQNEAGIHFLAPLVQEYAATGRMLERPGTRSELGAPSGVFRANGSERFLAVSAQTDRHWLAVRQAVAPLRTDAYDDLSNDQRLARRDEIEAVFAEWLARIDVFDAANLLLDAGCPAYPSLRARDLIRDPQLSHRGFFTELPHRVIKARYDGPVTQFSASPWSAHRAGPTIGEDSEYVLADLLGFTEDEIVDLAAAGVLT